MVSDLLRTQQKYYKFNLRKALTRAINKKAARVADATGRSKYEKIWNTL